MYIIWDERFALQSFVALKWLDRVDFSWLLFYSTWPWPLHHRQCNSQPIVASLCWFFRIQECWVDICQFQRLRPYFNWLIRGGLFWDSIAWLQIDRVSFQWFWECFPYFSVLSKGLYFLKQCFLDCYIIIGISFGRDHILSQAWEIAPSIPNFIDWAAQASCWFGW